jgi:hypothetical protein
VSSVDVVPLGDKRKHMIPEGYTDVQGSKEWEAIVRRIEGLFQPCWCSPWLEPVFSPDGGINSIYVHRAADQRERTERMAS